ncbi:TrmB family transcriptional regulator [Natronomonas salina]|uniref:TrmB family transcriptional regulator n=1 Tax=Natronomonas salina TaxID=1710540 RepID=UPI0015B5F389|nr:TrmB family transcriptional regulator [Natronomonas salina]QLD90303.1 TrmB family transcriptional regulator [Natronomonas salina]
MSQTRSRDEAVDSLEQLGLKEYEARCFVALTRLDTGTAKEVSDISSVPRTRVYDAIENLEETGLIFVQHGSPKRFRAVGIDEAVGTLRRQKDERIDTLETHLQSLEPPADDAEGALKQEVWSVSGSAPIQARTEDAIADADSEIVLLVVEEGLLTDEVVERLRAADERGVSIIVGGATAAIADTVRDAVPGVAVFESELDWLLGPETSDEVAISRLLLTDRERLLVGSFYPDEGRAHEEQAILANGLENGVVVVLRRLLESGFLPEA